MRDFMEIVNSYLVEPTNVEILTEDIQEIVPIKSNDDKIVLELEDLIFKLRAAIGTNDNEIINEGYELGMNKAAELLENILIRNKN